MIDVNTSDVFPHLPKAPIVEAAISWQAAPAEQLEPKRLHEALKDKLPEYPQVAPQVEVSLEHHVSPEGSRTSQSHAWQAFQIERKDEPYVAQFRKNGLVVSRLQPYQRWSTFRDEALRLWGIYSEIASPPEIQRIGLRYINLVAVDSLDDASGYLRTPPTFPGEPIGSGLPLAQFMHQSRFEIPGHDLQLNLVQTVQPAAPWAQTQVKLNCRLRHLFHRKQGSDGRFPRWKSVRNHALAEEQSVSQHLFRSCGVSIRGVSRCQRSSVGQTAKLQDSSINSCHRSIVVFIAVLRWVPSRLSAVNLPTFTSSVPRRTGMATTLSQLTPTHLRWRRHF
jgi:uncharacterized protein (TIGR04255 family)